MQFHIIAAHGFGSVELGKIRIDEQTDRDALIMQLGNRIADIINA